MLVACFPRQVCLVNTSIEVRTLYEAWNTRTSIGSRPWPIHIGWCLTIINGAPGHWSFRMSYTAASCFCYRHLDVAIISIINYQVRALWYHRNYVSLVILKTGALPASARRPHDVPQICKRCISIGQASGGRLPMIGRSPVDHRPGAGRWSVGHREHCSTPDIDPDAARCHRCPAGLRSVPWRRP